MRVLRIGLGDGRILDLHPAVSVVPRLADQQRTTLRRAFRAVGTGLEPAVPGLLECHGLLLDATQADLDLIDAPLDPARAVSDPSELTGAVADDDAPLLDRTERDLLLLAIDRAQVCDALARAEAAAVRPTASRLRARAATLRARIDRHDARDHEAVRVALDRVRDGRRTGPSPGSGAVVDALRAVGLDVGDVGLADAEVFRIAEDWLDEWRLEAGSLVGVEVELRGIEAILDQPAMADGGDDVHDLDVLRARATRAAAAHAEAIDRVEVALAARSHHPGPVSSTTELERHLMTRLVEQRPARLAGSVPLVLDGMFEHLDAQDVDHLLDRVAALAGSVQLVVVDRNRAVERWAGAAGVSRAAVVEPTPEDPTAAPA